MTVRSVAGRTPRIHPGAWVDPAALVIGDVELAEGVSIWPFTVVRGDEGQSIRIGRNTNVQDNSVVHVTPEQSCVIGEGVTIGHRAVVHACTIGNKCLVGMGSVVLDNVVTEDLVMIGAGSVVPPGKRLETRSLYVGSPARKVRDLSQAEIDFFTYSAAHYVKLKDEYLEIAG